MKMTLNNIEKSRFQKYLLDNINSFNNRTSEDIARECNEELNFKRKDGKEIILNAHHVNTYHEIFTQNGWEVWIKNELKETFSIWDLMKKIEDVEKRVSDLESERLTEIHTELDEGEFDGTRDQQIAFATNKSKGEAMNNLLREDN